MMLFVAILFVVLGAVVLYRFVVRAYLPVASDDLDAFERLYGAPETPAARRLYGAYLSRARRYRSSWSAAGWGAAIFLGWQFQPVTLTFGPGAHPVYADLLIMGFGGYLSGAIGAELHHLRGRAGRVRTASLDPRSPARYVSTRMQVRLRAIVAFAVLAAAGYGVLHLTRFHSHPFSFAVVGFTLAAVIVWIVVEAAERAVVGRARPALPEDLASGDDAIRAAATQTLVTGGAGFVLLLVSWGSFVATQSLFSSWESAYAFFAIFCLIWAIQLAFRTRRLAWPVRKIAVEGLAA